MTSESRNEQGIIVSSRGNVVRDIPSHARMAVRNTKALNPTQTDHHFGSSFMFAEARGKVKWNESGWQKSAKA